MSKNVKKVSSKVSSKQNKPLFSFALFGDLSLFAEFFNQKLCEASGADTQQDCDDKAEKLIGKARKLEVISQRLQDEGQAQQEIFVNQIDLKREFAQKFDWSREEIEALFA